MIDIKLVRKEPEKVKELLSRRDPALASKIDELLVIDEERRKLIKEVEELKSKRNALPKKSENSSGRAIKIPL